MDEKKNDSFIKNDGNVVIGSPHTDSLVCQAAASAVCIETSATTLLTFTSRYLCFQAKKDDKHADSSPETSRPASTHARKEGTCRISGCVVCAIRHAVLTCNQRLVNVVRCL